MIGWKQIWKWCGRKWSWPICSLSYTLPGVTEENHKIISIGVSSLRTKIWTRAFFVRFQVSTVASMKIRAFWAVVPCSPGVDWCFRGVYCFHHHLSPWWWRQYAPLKPQSTSRLHSAISQKAPFLMKVFVTPYMFVIPTSLIYIQYFYHLSCCILQLLWKILLCHLQSSHLFFTSSTWIHMKNTFGRYMYFIVLVFW
jgi:hypothetical protein